jgi:hypothetical protein
LVDYGTRINTFIDKVNSRPEIRKILMNHRPIPAVHATILRRNANVNVDKLALYASKYRAGDNSRTVYEHNIRINILKRLNYRLTIYRPYIQYSAGIDRRLI